MAGLHLYRSNRLEALAAALGEITRRPLQSVFTREVVVVQSLGMRRWLSLELASQHGVAMNTTFPFPGDFLQTLFSAVLPADDGAAAFDRTLLPWRVLALLPSMMERLGSEDLKRYVSGEMRALKQYQLAGKIAHVYDRYLAYRPELILSWQQRRTSDSGDGPDWQEDLWRELSRGHETAHAPAKAREFSARLRRGEFDRAALPERVSIFGISSLPPFYIQLFGELARQIDVHLFALEPTPEYWGDLRSLKEQDRISRAQSLTPSELHLDTGNPLLSSLGKLGASSPMPFCRSSPPVSRNSSIHLPEPRSSRRCRATFTTSAIASLAPKSSAAPSRPTTARSRSTAAIARCANWRCCTISCSRCSMPTQRSRRGISSSPCPMWSDTPLSSKPSSARPKAGSWRSPSPSPTGRCGRKIASPIPCLICSISPPAASALPPCSPC
jgi:hypothetical protein